MQNKSLAESVRSRLALGQTVELEGVTVCVHAPDIMMDVIFAVRATGDETPWRYEIAERGRSTRLRTIDEVLAHLERIGAV